MKDQYTAGSEFFYNNRKCKIINNSGYIYFTIIQYEDGTIDSVFKYDLEKEPSVPLKTKIILIGEAFLYLITLGLYRPKYT